MAEEGKINQNQTAKEISKKDPNQIVMGQIKDMIMSAMGFRTQDDKGNVVFIGRPVDSKVVSEVKGNELAEKIMEERRAVMEGLKNSSRSAKEDRGIR